MKLCHKEGMGGQVLEDTLGLYTNGINWGLLREYLENKKGYLEGAETRGLQLVATDALWTEERRWLAGQRGEGSCEVCLLDTGTKKHRLHDCIGTVMHLAWRQAAGRVPRQAACADDPRLLPLMLFALPPKLKAWVPNTGKRIEGMLSGGPPSTYYGDGSGKHQDCIEDRVATWALWCPSRERDDEVRQRKGAGRPSPEASRRGAVCGWFPTVPRGELTALLDFLQRAPPRSVYVGDCKYVMDAAIEGVPYKYCSSASLDADLWRPVKKILEGRTHLYGFRRVRAHRSRAAATIDGELAVQDWEGNDGADELAKLLTRSCAAEKALKTTAEQEASHGAVLRRLAAAMGWALRNWPANDPKKKRRGGGRLEEKVNEVLVWATTWSALGAQEASSARDATSMQPLPPASKRSSSLRAEVQLRANATSPIGRAS